MPLHSDLTGAELHEPKGVSGASANQVYVADGAGSGAWGKLTKDSFTGSGLPFVWQYLGNFSFPTSPDPQRPFLESATIEELMFVYTGTNQSATGTLTLRNNSASTNTIYALTGITNSTDTIVSVTSGLTNTAITKANYCSLSATLIGGSAALDVDVWIKYRIS